MGTFRVSIIVAVLVLPATAFAQSYICTSDLVTGFLYDEKKKSWKQSTFKEGDKYLVTRSQAGRAKWEVKEFGKPHSFARCDDDFNESGWLLCAGGLFRMSKNNMRFLRAFPHGYWFVADPKASQESLRKDGGDTPYNTPYIEIGKCSIR